MSVAEPRAIQLVCIFPTTSLLAIPNSKLRSSARGAQRKLPDSVAPPVHRVRAKMRRAFPRRLYRRRVARACETTKTSRASELL